MLALAEATTRSQVKRMHASSFRSAALVSVQTRLLHGPRDELIVVMRR